MDDKIVVKEMRCPVCKKLLAKERVRIYNSVNGELIKYVSVEHGLQTKCRRCKRIREVLTVTEA